MKKDKKIARIKVLIDCLENDGTVRKDALHRVLTKEQMSKYDLDWEQEIKYSRKKPSEIIEYEDRFCIAVRKHGVHDRYYHDKMDTPRERELRYEVEGLFARLIERAGEIISCDPGMVIWFDRDMVDAEASVSGVPRIVTSRSLANLNPGGFYKRSKRDIALEILHQALSELSPPTAHDLTLVSEQFSIPENCFSMSKASEEDAELQALEKLLLGSDE